MMKVTSRSAIARCLIIKLILDFRCLDLKSEMNTVRLPTAATTNRALYTRTTVSELWLNRKSVGYVSFISCTPGSGKPKPEEKFQVGLSK